VPSIVPSPRSGLPCSAAKSARLFTMKPAR
jgi:hypothetical protein